MDSKNKLTTGDLPSYTSFYARCYKEIKQDPNHKMVPLDKEKLKVYQTFLENSEKRKHLQKTVRKLWNMRTEITQDELKRARREKEELQTQIQVLLQDLDKLEKRNAELQKAKDEQSAERAELAEERMDKVTLQIPQTPKMNFLHPVPVKIFRHQSSIVSPIVNLNSATTFVSEDSPLGFFDSSPTNFFGSATKKKSSEGEFEANQEEIEKMKQELQMANQALLEQEKLLAAEKTAKAKVERLNHGQNTIIKEREREIKNLKARLEDVRRECVDMTERFKQQENERAKKNEARIQELEEAIKKIEELMAAQTEEMNKKDKEIEELRQEVAMLKGDIDGKIEEIELLKKEESRLKDELGSLEEELKGLKEAQIAEDEENTIGSQEGIENEEENDDNENREDYKSKLSRTVEQIALIEQEKERISTRVTALEDELREVKKTEEAYEKSLKEAMDANQQEKKVRNELAQIIENQKEEVNKLLLIKEELERALEETNGVSVKQINFFENQPRENLRRNLISMRTGDTEDWLITETSDGAMVRENPIEIPDDNKGEAGSPAGLLFGKDKTESPRKKKERNFSSPLSAEERREEPLFVVREQEEQISERRREAPQRERRLMARVNYPGMESDDLFTMNDPETLRAALSDLSRDREELHRRLVDMENFYGQKIEEMSQELKRKDEYIGVLEADIVQMKEYILQNSPNKEEAGEKSISLNQEKIELNTSQLDDKDFGMKNQDLEKSKGSINDDGSIEKGNVVKNGIRKKGKTNSLHIALVANRISLFNNSSALNKSTLDAKDESDVLSQASSKSPSSKRKQGSETGSKREKDMDPVYKQLEKIILDLNEKLVNANKNAKADMAKKEEELIKKFEEREAMLREEMEKVKEEKKTLEKKIDDLEWKHAYDLIALQKAQMEKETTSQSASQTPKNKKNTK